MSVARLFGVALKCSGQGILDWNACPRQSGLTMDMAPCHALEGKIMAR